MITRRDLADDEGLTLIELTISIGVLGIIIIPLIASFLLAMLESSSSRERTADATAAELISTYLQNDIQSSCLRVNPAVPSSACGADSVIKNPVTPGCATDQTLLELAWQDTDASHTKTVVDYVVKPTSDGQKELHRVSCTGANPAEDVLLALNLETAKFDAKCYRIDDTVITDCVGELPATIAVEIRAESTRVNNKSSYKAFTFTYEGQRRVGS